MLIHQIFKKSSSTIVIQALSEEGEFGWLAGESGCPLDFHLPLSNLNKFKFTFKLDFSLDFSVQTDLLIFFTGNLNNELLK